MFGNNVLGIIFAYAHEERVRDLTELRVMASVPFGGRYRLVDFTLSNMVNSGLNKVGIITEDSYQSLAPARHGTFRESARVCTCCRRSANRLREPTARSNRSIPFAAS